MRDNNNRIQLSGFNNLTKTLSFNIYDLSFLRSVAEVDALIEYINDQYSSARLTGILRDVARIIGANVLNVATADYEPSGASTTLLISEETPALAGVTNQQTPGPLPEAVVAHLDKSHLTAHTYPETHPGVGANILRTDIDVSTCGMISPLKALNYLIHSFNSDVVVLDYRVRGFTRSECGKKLFIDHDINSIQSYIDTSTLAGYHSQDCNLRDENIFHTKMRRRTLRTRDYLLDGADTELSAAEQSRMDELIHRELDGIYRRFPN